MSLKSNKLELQDRKSATKTRVMTPKIQPANKDISKCNCSYCMSRRHQIPESCRNRIGRRMYGHTVYICSDLYDPQTGLYGRCQGKRPAYCPLG